MKTSKYVRSIPGEKGLEMVFMYRGMEYSVIRSFTYPESESLQHKREQEHIDWELDKPIEHEGELEKAEESLKSFFELIK